MRVEKLSKSQRSSMSWTSVVHVVLVQATNLMAMDEGHSSDPYCRITLAKERCRSRTISKTVNPKWREGFDLFWNEDGSDHDLEFSLFDKDIGSKDDFMGKYVCRTSTMLNPPKTKNMATVIIYQRSRFEKFASKQTLKTSWNLPQHREYLQVLQNCDDPLLSSVATG